MRFRFEIVAAGITKMRSKLSTKIFLFTVYTLDVCYTLSLLQIQFVAWTYDSSEILLGVLDNQTTVQ